MLIGYKRGEGSIVLRVKILDSSVTTGAGLTGLDNSSSGLIISTIADNEASATAYTVAAGNVEDITALGTYQAPTAGKCRFKEVDASNHPGVYEIHLADARYAVSSAKSLLMSVSGATDAAETDVVIPLRDLDPYDAVRAGLSALPNAAADAAGGLPTSDAGGLDLDALRSDVAAILVDTGTTLPGQLTDGTVQVGTIQDGAIGAAAVIDIWSTQTLTEAYAADGAEGTPAQLLYMIQQMLTEFAISSTTLTTKKLDGATTAATFTLDSATQPTSLTRAT